MSLRLLVSFAVDYFVLTFATALTKHRFGREPARRAEGLGRYVNGVSVFSHTVGVRALWKTVWDSVFARLNNGGKVSVRRENDMGFQGEIDKKSFFEQLFDKFYAFLEENLHGMSSHVVSFARNAA